MVSGVSSISSYQYQPQRNFDVSLTDDQKEQLQEIISKYDPENMDRDSMEALMDEIKSAGITPGKDFREIMDAAGFKPPERPTGPPPAKPTDEKELPQFVLDYLSKDQAGEATQEDVDLLLQNLKNLGESTTGTIVDKKV